MTDYLMTPVRERAQTTEQEQKDFAQQHATAPSPQISHAPPPQDKSHAPQREAGLSR